METRYAVIDHTTIERVLFAGTNQYKYCNEMVAMWNSCSVWTNNEVMRWSPRRTLVSLLDNKLKRCLFQGRKLDKALPIAKPQSRVICRAF